MSELRVAVVERSGAVPVFRLVDRPAPAPGSALVSVLACALDADDVRLLQVAGPPDGGALPEAGGSPEAGSGAGPAWPVTPGRHFVGAIDTLGTGRTEDAGGQRLRPGTPVLVPSVIPCGACGPCLHPPRHAGLCLRPVRLGAGPGFAEAPLLAGGVADAVFVARGAIHALPLTMPPWLASLAEPLAVCLRAYSRAQEIGRFPPGASVVVVGRDATALLAVLAALELGAGRVVVVGGPDAPFLVLARRFGAEATIDVTDVTAPAEQVEIVRETVGGRGADLVLALGPDTGPDTVPDAVLGACPGGALLGMLREGGTLVTGSSDLGVGPLGRDRAMLASRLIGARQLTILGSAGFASSDIPVALGLLYRVRGRYDLAAVHARFAFTAPGLAQALAALRSGVTPRALIVQRPDLAG